LRVWFAGSYNFDYLQQTEGRLEMSTAIYVGSMVVVIVAVDLLFFKDRVSARLAVNAGIVLIFAIFYFLFLKRR
jgi:multidrug transporter EmrE-like cation transporter